MFVCRICSKLGFTGFPPARLVTANESSWNKTSVHDTQTYSYMCSQKLDDTYVLVLASCSGLKRRMLSRPLSVWQEAATDRPGIDCPHMFLGVVDMKAEEIGRVRMDKHPQKNSVANFHIRRNISFPFWRRLLPRWQMCTSWSMLNLAGVLQLTDRSCFPWFYCCLAHQEVIWGGGPSSIIHSVGNFLGERHGESTKGVRCVLLASVRRNRASSKAIGKIECRMVF